MERESEILNVREKETYCRFSWFFFSKISVSVSFRKNSIWNNHGSPISCGY